MDGLYTLKSNISEEDIDSFKYAINKKWPDAIIEEGKYKEVDGELYVIRNTNETSNITINYPVTTIEGGTTSDSSPKIIQSGEGTYNNPFIWEPGSSSETGEIEATSSTKNITEIDLGGAYVQFGHFDSVNEMSSFSDPDNWESYLSNVKSIYNGTFVNENTSASLWFSNIETFDVKMSNVTNTNSMFQGCSKLVSFNSILPNLEEAISMFNSCTSLKSFKVDMPKLNSSSGMFSGCKSLETFESEMNNITNIANFSSMFNDCTSLKEVRIKTTISDTSKITKTALSIQSGAKLYVNDVEIK